ncbi:MAG: hypothetical protein HY906_00540 [Deltaproteobacteria bacterium]|nr:hypothetical protein [Deltaproteobacteria bacterium]
MGRKLLRAADECVVLAVALARCGTCRHRERVLPRDVLPGTVTSVAVIFSAVTAVERGERVPAVARRHGVCPLTIRLWLAGLTTPPPHGKPASSFLPVPSVGSTACALPEHGAGKSP